MTQPESHQPPQQPESSRDDTPSRSFQSFADHEMHKRAASANLNTRPDSFTARYRPGKPVPEIPQEEVPAVPNPFKLAEQSGEPLPRADELHNLYKQIYRLIDQVKKYESFNQKTAQEELRNLASRDCIQLRNWVHQALLNVEAELQHIFAQNPPDPKALAAYISNVYVYDAYLMLMQMPLEAIGGAGDADNTE